MGAFSSINFKKSTSWQIYHNSDIRPSYAIGGKLECNRNAAEALNLRQEMIDSAFERYTARTGQKPQAKNYEWSAVVNLKPDTTMADLDKLAQHFQKKYGLQCYQIAIHRDEGHINEQGEKVINHHAHLEFVTLDKETGVNNFKRSLITKQVLRDMQTEVAEILQMERGVDKRLSGAKRIEPRAYAAMKEKEKLERAELSAQNKTLQAENANLARDLRVERDKNADLTTQLAATKADIMERWRIERQNLIDSHAAEKSDYDKLKKERDELLEKAKAHELTIAEMNRRFADLRAELEKERKAREKVEKENAELTDEYNELVREYNTLLDKYKNLETAYTAQKQENAELRAKLTPTQQTTHSVETPKARIEQQQKPQPPEMPHPAQNNEILQTFGDSFQAIPNTQEPHAFRHELKFKDMEKYHHHARKNGWHTKIFKNSINLKYCILIAETKIAIENLAAKLQQHLKELFPKSNFKAADFEKEKQRDMWYGM